MGRGREREQERGREIDRERERKKEREREGDKEREREGERARERERGREREREGEMGGVKGRSEREIILQLTHQLASVNLFHFVLIITSAFLTAS